MMETPVIELRGSEFEQGVQHGRQLRDVILYNLERTREKLRDTHCDMERYEAFLQKNAVFYQSRHPELYEEMKGIAEGADLSFDDILMLNIPAYFMTDFFAQECTMVMARGKATADGCTYVIKNRDMSMGIQQRAFRRVYPDGLVIVEVNGAGIITYPAGGLNNRGLTVTTTGFWSKKAAPVLDDVESRHIFMNVQLLLKNCSTIDEMLEYIDREPCMNGLNIIAADKEKACVVEMTRDRRVVQWDDGTGILYRSNHYFSEELKELNPEPDQYPSTFNRSRRVKQLLDERYGRVRFQDLFRILSDHTDAPNCLCRHPEGDAKGKTVSTSLFVLEDNEAWTTLGNPCMSLRYATLEEK